ncbi:hypothetical protein [Elioraea thermophila]|uniref:hypothetical protein n=1 Tax=Elioraea thermophila TaxID=2185104 RepID=UPI00130057C7|nr:hypothetical protein [Elioraea thermophila]
MTSLWAAMLGAWLAAGPSGAAQPLAATAELDARPTPPSQASAEVEAAPLPERRRRAPPAACST